VEFFLKTWTGRILLVNTAVFIAMCFSSHSFLLPDPETLTKFGAKDPGGLAHGEWWRLFTPMFVHVGFIHFALNSLALFYIGQQIEQLVGARWFLIDYFIAGLVGGVASAVFTVGVSAGASGAIFGLLGVGFVFERLVARKIRKETGQRLRRGPYTGLVIVNLIIGFIISQGGPIGIDNAAHVGGLLGGCSLCFAMLCLKQNRLLNTSKIYAWIIFLLLALFVGIGSVIGTSPDYIETRLYNAARDAEGAEQKYIYYTEAIEVNPKEPSNYFERGKLLLLHKQNQEAFADFSKILATPPYRDELVNFVHTLREINRDAEATALETFLTRNLHP
jgi:rhomboid protease GluP